jgi:hypothetical protein
MGFARAQPILRALSLGARRKINVQLFGGWPRVSAAGPTPDFAPLNPGLRLLITLAGTHENTTIRASQRANSASGSAR